MVQYAGEIDHNQEGIIPEGIYLNRLARARGHHPIFHLGVHPGQLYALFTAIEQAIFLIHFDVVACAAAMPVDNLFQHGKERLYEGAVACRFVVGANRFKVPERGIDRVVFGEFTYIGKAVGQHTLVHKMGVGAQDTRCNLGSPGTES